MKISCIALDDDPIYLELVSNYIKDDSRLSLKGQYTNPAEAAEHLGEERIDLLFLDMEMEEVNGVDFVRTLEIPGPYIIFITSHHKYALESYDVSALDYIVKPFKKARFTEAVNKAVGTIEKDKKSDITDKLLSVLKSEEDYFVIRTDAFFAKIKYKEAMYFEAMENFVKIYTAEKTYLSLISLKHLEYSVPPHAFIRIHRSYIVGIRHITGISGMEVFINETALPLGASYKENVMAVVVNNNLIKRKEAITEP